MSLCGSIMTSRVEEQSADMSGGVIVVSLASVIVAGDTSYDRTDQASEAASAAAPGQRVQ
jgi:hypothetical protein